MANAQYGSSSISCDYVVAYAVATHDGIASSYTTVMCPLISSYIHTYNIHVCMYIYTVHVCIYYTGDKLNKYKANITGYLTY